MRAVLVGVAATVLVAALGGSAVGRQTEKIDANLIVGKWTPSDEGKKGVLVVEFTKDGKVKHGTFGKDPVLEGTYKLDGNKLTLTLKFGDVEETKTRTVHSLTKKELVTTDVSGSKNTLVRVK